MVAGLEQPFQVTPTIDNANYADFVNRTFVRVGVRFKENEIGSLN
jgi:hypothetical protein